MCLLDHPRAMLRAIEVPSAVAADAAASAASVFADFSVVPFGLDASMAHAFADPPDAVKSPTAYSFELYSLVSTWEPVVVAHSLDAPFEAVVVTPVPPTAQAFAEWSDVAPLTPPFVFCA